MPGNPHFPLSIRAAVFFWLIEMQNRLTLGVLCVVVGAAVFSIQDAVIKAISGGYPVTEAIALRAIVALPILSLLVHFDGGLRRIASPRFGWLTLRAVIQFFSYTSYYLAIAALPLADAVALFFVAPLVIVVLAWPVLGERVSWQVLAAVCVGLAGVVVMLDPGDGVFEWAAPLSVGAAVAYATSQIIARKISDSETAPVMSFYQNGIYLVGALLVAVIFASLGVTDAPHPSLQFLVRPWQWPTVTDALLMGSCGVIAAIGMVLLTQAYRLAPANSVAPFEYVGILWPPLWGFVFFAEIPQARTVLGAAIIVGAGLFALGAGRRKAVVVTPQPSPT